MINIGEIKGIGPKTAELFEKLGIETDTQLITHYPFRYDVIKRTSLDEPKAVIPIIVQSVPVLSFFGRNRNRLTFRGIFENNLIDVVVFNRGYLKNKIIINEEITIIGTYNKSNNNFVVSNLYLKPIKEVEGIIPVYRTTNGLKQSTIMKSINKVINTNVESTLPKYIEEKYNYNNYPLVIKEVHQPTNIISLNKALQRIKFEEIFEFMFKVNYLKYKKENIKRPTTDIDQNKIDEFIGSLKFDLTIDQVNSVDEIIGDLKSDTIMNRMIQGDVGSGKTIVSFIATYANYLRGKMTSLMAPTEILANQHYESAKSILPSEMKIEIITGKTTKKQREKIKESLNKKQIDLLIGTHALLTEDLELNNLGLVITDEQHRFGVNQRGVLKDKGKGTDVLYLSATPIPRTYALTLFGDMEISFIKTMPVGRKPVITTLKKESEIKEVLEEMLRELKKGHQIYVIAPSIEESEDELESVNNVYKNMNSAFSKYFKVGQLHGKMKNNEKTKIMEDYKKGLIDILVSTTVIEVGVDVKNATMIVIYDSHMFGLSTLHQLRGRVGRNNFESKCILISKKETKRLEILTKTNDGFLIAEEDFKLRGSGELFGNKQSGDMNFKQFNLKTDFELLKIADIETKEYLKDITKINIHHKNICKKLNNIS